MKKFLVYFIFISFIFLFINACEKDDNGDQNNPPVASFTVNPQNGITSTLFQFDASGSSDDDQPTAELEVRWDWTNDGTWDTDYSTEKTANHQYSIIGDKTIKLEVIDNEGLTDSASKSITVTDEVLNFTTGSVSDIETTSAKATGEILSIGSDQITDHGHCWSLFPDTDINDFTTSLGSVSEPGTFTSTTDNLTESLTYYVKAYVTTSREIFYGDEISFKAASSGNGDPCPGAETVTDADGNVYNTVMIGGKCWMRENLNVGQMINSSQNQNDNNTPEKYCYNDKEEFCSVYGGLYQWNELMQYAKATQGLCPEGWHVPTYEEIESLKNSGTNGNDFISIGQNSTGTNNTGFSALLNGYKGYIPPDFAGFGETVKFWSVKKHPSGNASIVIGINQDGSIAFETLNHQTAVSARCVKD